ncbi:hypothetical protein ACFV0C_22370 [Streptomyces sp. NPDC059568]|uniref:hypothetical protein n=1 Tax=Streptomyces sp. NPDC059568 TaxID=3346868 RepID=UPI00369128B5
MSHQPSIRNELSGHVEGDVVQAGHIHGNVVFHPPVQGLAPEHVQAHARLLARAEAQARAEDEAMAAAEEAHAKRLGKVRRRKRIFFWLQWACIATGLTFAQLGRITIDSGFVWVIVTLLAMLGYTGAKYELHFGRRVPWSSYLGR